MQRYELELTKESINNQHSKETSTTRVQRMRPAFDMGSRTDEQTDTWTDTDKQADTWTYYIAVHQSSNNHYSTPTTRRAISRNYDKIGRTDGQTDRPSILIPHI